MDNDKKITEFVQKNFGNEQVVLLDVLVKLTSLDELKQTLKDCNRTVLVLGKNTISNKNLKMLSSNKLNYDNYIELSIMAKEVDVQYVLDFISANKSLNTLKTMEVLAHEKFNSDDYDSNRH